MLSKAIAVKSSSSIAKQYGQNKQIYQRRIFFGKGHLQCVYETKIDPSAEL